MERKMMGGIKKIGAVFVLAFTFFSAAAQSGKYYETDAVVLQDKCVLWQMGDDGKLVDTKETLGVGAEIKVRATSDYRMQVQTLTWTSGRVEQSGNFIRIDYMDRDYYIFDGRIALGMVPGIITVPSAAIYRTRNLADITGAFLVSGKVLAVGKTYEIVGGISMSEIAYFSAESQGILRGYVRADRVSANRDDIKAIEMLALAEDAYSYSQKRQIVSSVKDLNVTGNVLEMIGEAEMRLNRSANLSLSGEVDVPTQTFYYADDGYIHIRDMPSTVGNSVGTLATDDDFTVIRRTARSQTLYGITDFWYYGVSVDKVDGWVFGGFLTPRPVEGDEKNPDAAEGEGADAKEGESGTEGNGSGGSTSEVDEKGL